MCAGMLSLQSYRHYATLDNLADTNPESDKLSLIILVSDTALNTTHVSDIYSLLLLV